MSILLVPYVSCLCLICFWSITVYLPLTNLFNSLFLSKVYDNVASLVDVHLLNFEI